MATNDRKRQKLYESSDEDASSSDIETSSSEVEITSDEDDSEDESLAEEPFRLMDLPREIRDQIYECMLAGDARFIGPTWPTNINRGEIYKLGQGAAGVDVLQACRQVYEEAKPILYSHCSFEFDADPICSSSIKAALYFLQNIVPSDALKNIQCLGFEMREEINSDGTTSLLTTFVNVDEDDYPDKYGYFGNLCALLAHQTTDLRHLTIHVHNRKKYSSPHQSTIDRSTEPHREVPGWVKPLLAIKSLHKLTLYWEYVDVSCLERTLKSAQLIRATMFKNLENKNKKHCTIRLRHNVGFGLSKQERHLEFKMDIDTKRDLDIERTRRVKVMPTEWCSSCGNFSPSSMFYLEGCACGAPNQNFRHKRCWNSNDWNGKPLQDFLPKNVTEDDYHRASAFADAGFRLQDKYVLQRRYTDSDFGDNDSLNSVHGWSDDEEADLTARVATNDEYDFEE